MNSICSLGKTQEKRDVMMLNIGHQDNKDKFVSHVLMIAGIHGNEAVGPELLLQIAIDICENNGKDFMISKVCIYGITLTTEPNKNIFMN